MNNKPRRSVMFIAYLICAMVISAAGFAAGQIYGASHTGNPVQHCQTQQGTDAPTCYIHDDSGAGMVVYTDYGRWAYELDTQDVIRTTTGE